MKITYLGTSSLIFDDGKTQIMFDAHVTRPAIPTIVLYRMKTDTAVADKVIDTFGLNNMRAIFISHSHHDHVMDAPYFSNRTGAVIYGSSSALNVGRGGGVPEDRMILYKPNDVYSIDDFKITVIPSIHSRAHFYNDDLGKEIKKPIRQPSGKWDYKEGGSVDFLVEHGEKSYLIRPSYNYKPGQLDGIKADVLFLGIGGLGRAPEKERAAFFDETIGKTDPDIVIPIHWDNFFRTLKKSVRGMPKYAESIDKAMRYLGDYCTETGKQMVIQLPLTRFEV